MSTQLERVFDYEGSKVRTVVINGEPWFVAKDVCDVLKYQNSRKAVTDHCKAARPVGSNDSLHPLDPQTTIIPERDVYRLIMRSRLPEAERFEEWVVGVVLPSIRKDGLYVTPELLFNPDHLLQVTQRLRDEYVARLAAEARVEELTPKADQWDKLSTSNDAQPMEAVAKIFGMGRNTLFARLRGESILMSNNRPYQRYLDDGYFKVFERTWTHPNGMVYLTTTTRVTGRGIAWLQKRLRPGA